MSEGIPQEQRRALTAAALLPAAVGSLKFPVWAAGRLAWLCPLAALPVGLLLCWVWKGRPGRFLEGTPGVGGWLLAGLYLAWDVILLWGSAAGSADRLLRSVGTGGHRWVILLTALLLTLYLTRRDQILARAGKLFFPVVVVLLLAVFLLNLPSLRWENLTPVVGREIRGVPAGAAWALSLSGYGIYAAFLPARREENGGERWSLWGCAALSALLLAMVGVFGPALTLRMDEPLLYLLSGAGVPGAFQRGEALLSALAALGDLALIGLLSQSGSRLWRYLFGRAGWIPTVAGFALALLTPGAGTAILTGWTGFWGNLILGAAIPLFSVLTGKSRRAQKAGPHFVDGK